MFFLERVEKSLIGCLLVNNKLFKKINKKIKTEDFLNVKNKIIFSSIKYLIKNKKVADCITVNEHLIKNKKESFNVFKYMKIIFKLTPNILNIKKYSNIIYKNSIYRKINTIFINFKKEIIRKRNTSSFKENKEKIKKILNFKKKEKVIETYDFKKEIVSFIKNFKIKEKKIKTGFKKLDNLILGFGKGDLVIIAGRPSMGKTSFLLNICEYISFEKNIPIAIFSLEMSIEQIIIRILCSVFKIQSKFLKKKTLKKIKKLSFLYKKLNKVKILIDDNPNLTPSILKKKIRKMMKIYKIKLIAIDYLQLMTSGKNNTNRASEISEISRSLKTISKKFKIPIIALSQLNRNLELRVDKTPIMSDIRESGSIEQDSDFIIFIHREEINKENKEVKIIVSKHRNGPTGYIKLKFIEKYSKFEEY